MFKFYGNSKQVDTVISMIRIRNLSGDDLVS